SEDARVAQPDEPRIAEAGVAHRRLRQPRQTDGHLRRLDRTQMDLHDVWALDLDPASPTFEKWQDLSVPQGRPAGRIDQSAIYDPDKNRMIFNGGWTKARKVWLGDTWAFWFGGGDAAARWEKIDTSRGAPPDRRYGVGVHDPDRHLYLLFGGENRS